MTEYTPRQQMLFTAMRESFRQHVKEQHPDWKPEEKHTLQVCCLTSLSDAVLPALTLEGRGCE